MSNLHRICIVFISLLITSSITNAQSAFKIDQEKSRMTISGTSSLHDWEMEVAEPKADVQLKLDENKLLVIESLLLTVNTEKISSGNKIMDNKTRSALKADKHNNITFEFLSVKELTSSNNRFTGIARGNLTVAGFKREVEVNFNGQVLDKDNIEVIGNQSLKMSDFSIESPTAMMGTLKTGDEITIGFKLVWSNRG